MHRPSHMEFPVFVDTASEAGVTYVGYSDEDNAANRPSEPIFHIQKITEVNGITTTKDNKGIKAKCCAWTARTTASLWT